MTEKMCNACGETKPYSEFNRNSETHDGYRYTCKLCRKNKVPTNPEYSRLTRKRQDKTTRKSYGSRAVLTGATDYMEIKRMDKYGLTVDQFNAMFQTQNGKCAICFKDLGTKYCIDHCHSTGAVRGLLCYSCNSGIGLLQDSPHLLQCAIEYLTSPKHHASSFSANT